MSKKVYVAVPVERSVQEFAFNSLLLVAAHCGKHGYNQIVWPYQRVDVARNNIVNIFMQDSHSDDDTLVMLDADHAHPADIVERLVAHDVGIVGALAFTRGAPFRPCFFYFVDGGFRTAMQWDVKGLMPCDAVGTGAIAIKRVVFRELLEKGYGPHYFQCIYPETIDIPTPSEDMYFAAACYHAGIKQHVDTSLVTPHLMAAGIDETYFDEWKRANPSAMESVDVRTEIQDPERPVKAATIKTRVDL